MRKNTIPEFISQQDASQNGFLEHFSLVLV
jgi:hypothetical protein